jgi:hypothetical protein
MACSTNRCALRRFDGHGSSSYRPTNPEVAREFQSRMDQMMVARGQQDQGVFVAPTTTSPHLQQAPTHTHTQTQIPSQIAQLQTHPVTFYPLSDSSPRK